MPNPKILLVDDHQDTLDLFFIVLSQLNYDVVAVTSVGRALEAAKKDRFDIFVLDTRLSDGSGIDLCRQIRKTDQMTPILFCSGMADEKNKQEALSAGAQAYLVKPITIPLMCESLAELISASRGRVGPPAKRELRENSGHLAAPSLAL